MPMTAVSLFESSNAADRAVRDLEAGGFAGDEIRVVKEPLGMKVTEVTSIPHTDFETSLGRDLEAMGASETEANSYVQGVHRGGVLVFATGSDEKVSEASGIMNRHGALELEELAGQESLAKAAGAHLSLPLETSGPAAMGVASMQTGRVRQSGDGVRMFVW